jgi:hypothetical protein
MSEVSVCVTSYKRRDYLDQCLLTFLNLNKYPIKKFIVIEDDPDADMSYFIDKYPKITFIINDEKLGQIRSIDKAYSMIDTKYIYHIEDDYVFAGNKNFMFDSIEILEERQDIHQIWCRHKHDHMAENAHSFNKLFEDQILLTQFSKIPYRMVSVPNTGNWCGFSFNTGLRRKIDYDNLFPEGYSKYLDSDSELGVLTEYHCNLWAMKNNYRAAHLKKGCCYNVGYENSTY